jgi:hypothetical protein
MVSLASKEELLVLFEQRGGEKQKKRSGNPGKRKTRNTKL